MSPFHARQLEFQTPLFRGGLITTLFQFTLNSQEGEISQFTWSRIMTNLKETIPAGPLAGQDLVKKQLNLLWMVTCIHLLLYAICLYYDTSMTFIARYRR